MVREKWAALFMWLNAPILEEPGRLTSSRYLEPRQLSEMSGQPRMIKQLAFYIRQDFETRLQTEVKVRVRALASLNGRPPSLLINPDVDLTRMDDSTAWLRPRPVTPPLAVWPGNSEEGQQLICTVKTLANFSWLGCLCSLLFTVIPSLAFALPGEVQADEPIEEQVEAKGEAAAPKVSSSKDADANNSGRSDLAEEDEDEIFDGEEHTDESPVTPKPQESMSLSGDADQKQQSSQESYDHAGDIRPKSAPPISTGSAQGSTKAKAPSDQDSPSDSSKGTPVDRTLDVVTIIGNQLKLERATGSAHKVSSKILETQETDDVHRVLKQVPGVYVRDEEGFGLRPNIGLRGAALIEVLRSA